QLFSSITMNKATILVIEGKHADHPAFAAALRNKGFEVELVSSGSQALTRLEVGFDPDAIVVNAASLRTSGKRICQSLREKTQNLPILLILDPDRKKNNAKAKATTNANTNANANVVLSLPFTIQKLVNRIRHLLPGDGKNYIHAGLIRLDMENRTVRCLGKQTRLTPRLMRLLKILLDHRGELVERRALFSQVWETEYTEDMRTLDVHISWLRRAIEADSDKPKLLKTVRGVGYRLDV
ncbi:MAG: response regulator transcription factor, partial [Chloroflexi bacterium]|nr:response regulator transcription factor [Chloroflexota bacterium]